MTTAGTTAVTASAAVHATMTVVVTDATTFETEIETETVSTTVDATMKNGIMTVDATNAITMTATVDVVRHADVPGVGGGTTDRGHRAVVRVSLYSVSTHSIKATR